MSQQVELGFRSAAHVVLLSAGLLVATQTLADELHAELMASSIAYLPDENITVQFTLSNNSKRPISILPWETPLAGLTGNSLSVTHNGEEVAYIGPMVMRREPRPQDYIIIAPGERHTVSMDIGRVYEMEQSGHYEVSWRKQQIDGIQMGAKGTGVLNVNTNSTSFELLGFREKHVDKDNTDIMAAEKRCTSSQLSKLGQAQQAARSNASRVRVENNTETVTWFGKYNASRYQTIANNFKNIASATSRLTYSCACNDVEDPNNVLAYVYKSQPYVVTLCPPFWREPVNGGNYSMASTLVHETSHFSNVANTDDIVYGITASQNLAKTNPSSAAKNADTYGFFSAQ